MPRNHITEADLVNAGVAIDPDGNLVRLQDRETPDGAMTLLELATFVKRRNEKAIRFGRAEAVERYYQGWGIFLAHDKCRADGTQWQNWCDEVNIVRMTANRYERLYLAAKEVWGEEAVKQVSLHTITELYELFGISGGSVERKSKQVEDEEVFPENRDGVIIPINFIDDAEEDQVDAASSSTSDPPNSRLLWTPNGNPDGQCYQTPRDVFEELNSIFGFTLDAAASDENALLPRYWTEEQDALQQDWSEEVAFCNPPFNNIGPFLAKARTARRALVLAPLNFLTSTDFQRVGADHIVVPQGRVRFVTGDTIFSPVLGTCFLIYGPLTNQETKRLGMRFSMVNETEDTVDADQAEAEDIHKEADPLEQAETEEIRAYQAALRQPSMLERATAIRNAAEMLVDDMLGDGFDADAELESMLTEAVQWAVAARGLVHEQAHEL